MAIEIFGFIYSVNKDKIVISTTDEAKRIENCILDITVKDIQDLRGNKMQSPATWTAYVDKNQVVWEEQGREFRKRLYDTLVFVTNIENQGGNEMEFTIENLPLWLKASPSKGKIKPNSKLKVTFTVNEGLNIGDYTENVYLKTSFGFNEIFGLHVKVYEPAPADWKVNPAKFQYSASMIGQIKVDNILSTDPEDKIAAFVGEECRGVASLNYIEAYDTYQAYMNIYSNSSNGEKVEFRIWDASQGLTLVNVTPFVGTVPNYNFTFEANQVIGSTSKPMIWHSINGILRKMPMPKGWKWVSFGLKSDAMFRTSLLLTNIISTNNDELRGAVDFDRYDSTTSKWFGNLAGDNMALNRGGLKNEHAYKVKLSKADTIAFRGSIINSLSMPIALQPGWNWVGYTPQNNMEINEALASINPSEGDMVKSQYQFAVYDAVLKWVGSLKYMIPGEGYMMKVAQNATLTYPRSGLVAGRKAAETSLRTVADNQWKLQPYDYSSDMALIAVVANDSLISEGDKIIALADTVCRGIATPVFDGKNKRQVFFITLYGNSTEKSHIAFKLKKANGKEYQLVETVAFANAKTEGTLQQPFELHLMEEPDSKLDLHNMSVVPNPFAQMVRFDFKGKTSGDVHIRITNVLGTEVRHIIYKGETSGELAQHSIVWDGRSQSGAAVAAGAYHVHISSDKETIDKLIIKE